MSESLGIPGRGVYTEEARKRRLEFIAKKRGVELAGLEHALIQAESLRGNIENYLTTVDIPVGLAGPLHLKGSDFSDYLYAPLATTEGALVASVSRGSVAITRSGGASARALRQRMTRAPLFELGDIGEAVAFMEWMRAKTDFLKKFVKKFSNYAELIELDLRCLGRTVHVRFVYTTQDAAGQNMTTMCTWNAVQWIVKQAEAQPAFKIRNYILEGGLSTDKKASFISAIEGRGTEVVAEALISKKIAREILFV
ncbi:MAG TPA: hypothetical protein VFV50_15645, partial [Bdellovibrionales bacterium]|nr:hypothetical protein [Bdellovibrionales bacterium]